MVSLIEELRPHGAGWPRHPAACSRWRITQGNNETRAVTGPSS